jgi:hypothetical protein
MIWRRDLVHRDEFHKIIQSGPNDASSLAESAMRTTATEIKFARPFVQGSLLAPRAAGTYRLKVNEEPDR